MRKFCATMFFVSACLTGCGNGQKPLRPLHIEAPEYDRVAYIAHIQGQAVVSATVDANGTVIETRASGEPMLMKSAMKNLSQWTFEKSTRPTRTAMISYEYRIEGPGQCGAAPPVVTFDLPDHVTIVESAWLICDPSSHAFKHLD